MAVAQAAWGRRYIRRNDAPLTSSTVPLAISAPGEAR
jgi:hypothetical protein